MHLFDAMRSPRRIFRAIICSSLLVCLLCVGGGGATELYGFRVDTADVSRLGDDSTVVIYSDMDVALRLFGSDFTSSASVSFTKERAAPGDLCTYDRTTAIYEVSSSAPNMATVTVNLPLPELTLAEGESEPAYFFCVKTSENATHFFHQGTDPWLRVQTEVKPVKTTILPLWLQVCTVVILLVFSGLFSGLNLGLMSLDQTELSIMENSGTPREKRYAKTIRPIRKRGNFLLCTILLGNVLVNNTLAILLDDLTGSGMVAIVGATLGIVVFGEIIPQALCSRYGLAVGARTIWFTKFFMVITFPLSYPISRILDCVLGEEIGYVFNRDRLRELLRITENQIDLKKDEVNIIAGALELSKKTVGSVMTKIDDVFMIEYKSVLDFDTMSLIMKTGYTRIPVYENERTNIVALLNIKDLAFIDPDDRTPLHTVCKFYNHALNFIFEDTRLDVMLEEFKKGRSHMAVVQRINDSGPGDPYYDTVGLVTLEDVIEEIIQSEIIDETDTVTDNRMKAPRKTHVKDFSIFNQPDDQNYPRLSPQLALATFQYLSTSVTPFKPEVISENILQRLIKQNVIICFRLTDPASSECFLYRSGKQCDCFIMILQGRVQVEFGKENLIFEGGPFVYFGQQALALPPTMVKPASVTSMSSLSEIIGTQQSPTTPYIPDYTVRAITDLQYIRIRRAHYMAALRATLLERQRRPAHPDGSQGGPAAVTSDDEEDAFTKEWKRAQKVLSASPSGITRSEVGSIRDDVSLRDGAAYHVSGDGTSSEVGLRTEFSGGTSPDRHQSGSFELSSPQENVSMPLVMNLDGKKSTTRT